MWLYISVLCLQNHYSRYHISGKNLSDDQERHIKILLWITLSVQVQDFLQSVHAHTYEFIITWENLEENTQRKKKTLKDTNTH